jgi:hypothetical protein
MTKRTFTIFNENDSVYGYLFNVTRVEAQEAVSEINNETGEKHYYMDGYLEQ